MSAFFNASVNSPLQYYCADREMSLSFFTTQSQRNQELFLLNNGGLRELYHQAIRFGIEHLDRNIRSGIDTTSRYLCFFKESAFAEKLWVWDSDPERLMVTDVGSDENGCLKGEALDYIRNTIGRPELFGEPLPELILCLADQDILIQQIETTKKQEERLKGKETDDGGEYMFPPPAKPEPQRKREMARRGGRSLRKRGSLGFDDT
ncbi:Hypothetical protein D9617_14g077250 [Elsinoe fawcettii]|nr:Hypothetical protein D9617_14g077250 [Elsinoe fawcettii]